MNRDYHSSLRSQIIKNINAGGIQVALAKQQWGKNDTAYSLHVSPSSFSTYGIQLTDFLNLLSFERSECSFINGGNCYVRWVEEGFDAEKFASSFNKAYINLKAAQVDLEKCGFFFDQPEGWGYFFDNTSQRTKINVSMLGDGHTSRNTKPLKENDDEFFLYKFTWLETTHEKGWTVHYRPKHLPLSSEIESVLKFLGLETFNECPEFDFESCYWKSIAHISRGDNIFDSNADRVHSWFDSHSSFFSSGIKKLLTANSEIEQSGLNFLPFEKPQFRLDTDIERRVKRPIKHSINKKAGFDVAISFAGTERKDAEKLATIIRDAGYSVFYDDFYPEYLWGKNLVDTFDEIYRKKSRFCVIFVSKEYKERAWTNHERQSAQARALEEKGKEYILPIKVDNTELTGMPPTTGFMSLSKGIELIGELLIKKLKE